MHLPPHPASAHRARDFLTGVLHSWRMSELAGGEPELLLSEVVTDALLNARSVFAVVVLYDGTSLRVEVSDGLPCGPRRPRLVDVRDRPDGACLLLLDKLAQRWGVVPTAGGRRVWFELPVPPQPT